MYVVTGASGTVGRSLVRALASAGERVTAVARRIEAGDVPAGVTHVRADLGEPATLEPALDGAKALFLLATGDDPQGVVEVAKNAGVRRIVLLSSLAVGTRPDGYQQARAFEAALSASELDWTVLRPTGFASNAYQWAEGIRTARTVVAPFPGVGLPVIDPEDIAEVAAVVLRDTGHAGHTYELTGPALVSPRDQAEAIGVALGAPIRVVEQSRADAHDAMLPYMPASIAESTLSILGEPTAAEQRVSPEVARLLGRPPRTFAEWAARNVMAFR